MSSGVDGWTFCPFIVKEKITILEKKFRCNAALFIQLDLTKSFVVIVGIDEDDIVAPGESGDANAEEMPPLEGDEDDASRMEEVD